MNLNRFELKNFILQTCSRFIKWTDLVSRESRGHVRGGLPPVDPTQGEEESTQALRLLQHFGFRSGPPKGAELVVVAPRGGPANAVAVSSEHFEYGPDDLQDGESCQYSIAYKGNVVCQVRIDKNGKVVIAAAANQQVTIDSGAGANIVLNGGDKNVARETDAVDMAAGINSMSQWVAAVTAYVNGLVPGTLVFPVNFGFIHTGAGNPRIKG